MIQEVINVDPLTEQAELTQAHLNSQALQDVLKLNIYDELSPEAKILTTGHSSIKRLPSNIRHRRRANMIIYSSVALAILLIITALASKWLKRDESLSAIIESQSINIPQLDAEFSLPIDQKSQIPNQKSSVEQTGLLNIILSESMLSFSRPSLSYSEEISWSESRFKTQSHPLQLHGGYLQEMALNIEQTWPLEPIKRGRFALDQSSKIGVALDIMTTLSIMAERRGQTLTEFAWVIHKSSSPVSKKTQAGPSFYLLPFKLVLDPRSLGRLKLLEISWDASRLYLIQKNRRKRFELTRRRSSSELKTLKTEISDIMNVISGIRGVTLRPTRSMTLQELTLIMAALAPYPVHIIPPKVSH